jgi:uncharacterized C2H2 Zn-finger protein
VTREHDTYLQDCAVCPYCGYVLRDAWELNFGVGLEGDTEETCSRCEKTFKIYRSVTVYYSTYKMEK